MAAQQEELLQETPTGSSRRKESRRRPQGTDRDRSTRIPQPEDGQQLQRKKSLRMNCKRSTKKAVQRDPMSSSSRRSMTPPMAMTDRRRRSNSPSRQRTCVDLSPIRSTSRSGSSSPRSVVDHPSGPECSQQVCSPPPSTLQPAWMCSCGEDNEGIQQFCGMCGTNKTWQCGDCNFENKCKFRFCGMCGISKKVKNTIDKEESQPPPPEPIAIAPNHWKCQGCEQINPCPFVFCSMCGSSKDPQGDELDPLNASFPPPFVTCRPEDCLHASLKSLESWSGDQ